MTRVISRKIKTWAISRVEKHQTYFNLVDACQDGCPLCSVVKKSVHKAMDDYLYESVNDPGLREEIRASQGFCNRHAWQLQKLGDGFGQAIVYSDLMNGVLQQLKAMDESASVKELFNKIRLGTTKKQICMFCGQEKDIEERYISVFWENFKDPEINIRYESSFGFCIPHSVFALKKCKNKKFSQKFVEMEAPKLSGLIGELKEFIRKHDYRFSREGFGKEGNAWIRAIEKMVGKEGVF